jgi:hypothetical protein
MWWPTLIKVGTEAPLVHPVSRCEVHDPKGTSGDLTNWERDPLLALWVAFKTQASFRRNDESTCPVRALSVNIFFVLSVMLQRALVGEVLVNIVNPLSGHVILLVWY